jgi:hypothetical protein
LRSYYILGWSYVASVVLVLWTGAMPLHVGGAGLVLASGPAGWFERARPHCNALEVEIMLRRDPPPSGMEGVGLGAACWALGGRIDKARALIMTLDNDERWRAAGIVFAIGHPVADMGDDRSAGPIMELVVEFWPNHYMALYHAGAARHALGEYAAAERHLTAFLEYYEQNDGWTKSAKRMLRDMEAK